MNLAWIKFTLFFLFESYFSLQKNNDSVISMLLKIVKFIPITDSVEVNSFRNLVYDLILLYLLLFCVFVLKYVPYHVLE